MCFHNENRLLSLYREYKPFFTCLLLTKLSSHTCYFIFSKMFESYVVLCRDLKRYSVAIDATKHSINLQQFSCTKNYFLKRIKSWVMKNVSFLRFVK